MLGEGEDKMRSQIVLPSKLHDSLQKARISSESVKNIEKNKEQKAIVKDLNSILQEEELEEEKDHMDFDMFANEGQSNQPRLSEQVHLDLNDTEASYSQSDITVVMNMQH